MHSRGLLAHIAMHPGECIRGGSPQTLWGTSPERDLSPVNPSPSFSGGLVRVGHWVSTRPCSPWTQHEEEVRDFLMALAVRPMAMMPPKVTSTKMMEFLMWMFFVGIKVVNPFVLKKCVV